MTKNQIAEHRNKVLFVNGISLQQFTAIEKLSEQLDKKIDPILLLDSKKTPKDWQTTLEGLTILSVDFQNRDKLQNCLKPYADQILTATCLGDGNVPYLRKVIPFLPGCILPTETSLRWTTEKIEMRELLRNYDNAIAPKSTVVHDDSEETIKRIEKNVGYPLVVKPSGLAASLLVSICYHREELEQVLAITIKKIDQIYKTKRGRGIPKILVEEYMEGSMYSVDAYVNAANEIYFAPIVYVKTGREVGFDDFFGYTRMTPSQLSTAHAEAAHAVAIKAIKALGMRSTSCHIEFLRTEDGWKIIELGPRIGGFRHEMYELSFGIDHSLNDILIRISQKPILSKKVLGYSAVMQFYAKKEGILDKIQGIYKIQVIQTLQRLSVKKEPGDRCRFAKNGGDPVLELVLFDPIRSNVLADIRRIEQSLNIITK